MYIGSTGSPLPSNPCLYKSSDRKDCLARSSRGHCRDTAIYRDSRRSLRQKSRASHPPPHHLGSLRWSIALLWLSMDGKIQLTALLREHNLLKSQCDVRNTHPSVRSRNHIARSIDRKQVKVQSESTSRPGSLDSTCDSAVGERKVGELERQSTEACVYMHNERSTHKLPSRPSTSVCWPFAPLSIFAPRA
jgi:hypothetical protein